MSTKTSDLAARMQATATHARPTAASVVRDLPAPAPAEARPPRTDAPARFTVELPRPQHRFVKRFALEADTDASTVTRALLSLLESDHKLAEQVRSMVGR